jgi:hypothetical protein
MTEKDENDIADEIAGKLLNVSMEVFVRKGVEPPDWDRLICLSIVRFGRAGEQITKRPWRKQIFEALIASARTDPT